MIPQDEILKNGGIGRVVTLTTNPTLDVISEVPQGAFPNPDVLRVEFRYRIGGKGITCTRMLEMLGGLSTAVILLGNDSISRCIEDYLGRENLETRILHTEGQGRICLILTEVQGTEAGRPGQRQTTGVDYRINGQGLRVNDQVLEDLLNTLQRSLLGAEALALAGSLPEGAPPDFYARCVETARALVPLVMLDSSGAPLQHGVKARPHLVKINGNEAAGLMKTAVPATAGEAAIIARSIANVYGVEKVIVTLGSAGAVALDGTDEWVVHAPRVEARGALGAGDSFFAGLAYGLTKGEPFTDALRWGAACGASTAEQQAGLVGDHARVLELLDRVQIEGLSTGKILPGWREASATSQASLENGSTRL
ncbi:MAG: 1-phosphofructokinase family hexose kinase [Bacteroidota bacterium]